MCCLNPSQGGYFIIYLSVWVYLCFFCGSVCHSEVNAIMTALKRTGDLSACTLYTTLSPCDDCSKTVAAVGIKNLVFAKYYREGSHMYDILGRIPNMKIR